jgi:hypothetical protein
MKPSLRRIVFFAAGVVAAFVVPVAIALLVGFLGPEPYLLDEDALGAEWSSPRQFPDGSTVAVTTHPSSAAAREEAAYLAGSIATSSTSQILDVVRYTRAWDGRRGLLLPVEHRIVQIEGTDDAAIDDRLRALPFLRENPEKNLLSVLFTRYAGLTFGGFALYVAALGVVMARGGSWAAEIVPPEPADPVPAATLRARILALNDLGLPFRVREEPEGLVAEWRIADERWIGLFEAGGVREVHRIQLRLDPERSRVRSVDDRRSVSWSAGTVRLGGAATFFRGISFFDSSRDALYGLFFSDGRWTTRAYDYRFVLSEMKTPLVQAVVGSGWTFAPVVTLSRPLAALLG